MHVFDKIITLETHQKSQKKPILCSQIQGRACGPENRRGHLKEFGEMLTALKLKHKIGNINDAPLC